MGATTCWPPRPDDSRSTRSTPERQPYLVADVTPLEDEVGDEARAERLAASAIRRFVRYLELLRAREGETSEVLDIRVEVDSVPAEDAEDEIVIDDVPLDDLIDDEAPDDDASDRPIAAMSAILRVAGRARRGRSPGSGHPR